AACCSSRTKADALRRPCRLVACDTSRLGLSCIAFALIHEREGQEAAIHGRTIRHFLHSSLSVKIKRRSSMTALFITFALIHECEDQKAAILGRTIHKERNSPWPRPRPLTSAPTAAPSTRSGRARVRSAGRGTRCPRSCCSRR